PQFQRHAAVQPKRSLTAVLADRNTVAVQRFADLSPSAELGYFCSGLSDEIINALTKVPQLRVVTQAAETAGGSPQAATIISGSVRKSGSELRITMQFVDTATGSYLWSETVDRNINDVFTVQQEVARAVVEKIKTDLIGERGRRAQRPQSAA